MDAPLEMTIMHLEVLVMPNGEVICKGTTIGWIDTLGKYLSDPATKVKPK